MILRPVALAFGLAIAAGPLAAQPQTCVARVNHQDLIIVEGAVVDGDLQPSLRERLLTWPGRSIDRLMGETPDCDSAVTMAFLAGMQALDQTDGYCLAEGDAGEGWILVPGDRNFRGRCRVTVCDRVNAARDGSLALAARITELATGQEVDDLGSGVRAVAHGSGAMLVTGQAPAIVQALGQGATAAGAALSSPTVAAAAAVSVVAIGGAVYVCSD